MPNNQYRRNTEVQLPFTTKSKTMKIFNDDETISIATLVHGSPNKGAWVVAKEGATSTISFLAHHPTGIEVGHFGYMNQTKLKAVMDLLNEHLPIAENGKFGEMFSPQEMKKLAFYLFGTEKPQKGASGSTLPANSPLRYDMMQDKHYKQKGAFTSRQEDFSEAMVVTGRRTWKGDWQGYVQKSSKCDMGSLIYECRSRYRQILSRCPFHYQSSTPSIGCIGWKCPYGSRRGVCRKRCLDQKSLERSYDLQK